MINKYNIIIATICSILLISITFNIIFINKIKVYQTKQEQIDSEFISNLEKLSKVTISNDDSNEFSRQIAVFSGRLSILSKKSSYASKNPDIITAMQYLDNLLSQPDIEKQYNDLMSLPKYIHNIFINPEHAKYSTDLISYLQQINQNRTN